MKVEKESLLTAPIGSDQRCTDVYYDLSSIWLPVLSMVPACCCVDRHCVLQSLVTSG